MSHITQLVNDLLITDSDLASYSIKLERENAEINNTISKTQIAFGNQHAGVALVTCMYKTLQSVTNADNALFLARQEIKKYIQAVRK